jgi:hypothetical protein
VNSGKEPWTGNDLFNLKSSFLAPRGFCIVKFSFLSLRDGKYCNKSICAYLQWFLSNLQRMQASSISSMVVANGFHAKKLRPCLSQDKDGMLKIQPHNTPPLEY